MNGDEFLRLLSEKTNRDEKETNRLVLSLADVIVGGLQDGNSVSLRGFGTFEVKKKSERIVVNHTTGKRTLFPPKLVIGFGPSASLKENINMLGDKK